MSAWKKVNFDDLPVIKPEDAPVDMRFARKALDSTELGLTRSTYEPGGRLPFGHAHHAQEEAYVVISGSGRAKLDDDVIDLQPGDVLRVAPNVARGIEAGPDGLEVICVGGRKPESPDNVRVDDFWE